VHKKCGRDVTKGDLNNDTNDLLWKTTCNIRKAALFTETVTFVAFHQIPATLYHQYLKKLCNLTSSITPSSFPVHVKEASCGTNLMYVSESSQTAADDVNFREVGPSSSNKEVQCRDGFDDTYFETILKYCREGNYSELRTWITKGNRQAAYDITVSQLPRFFSAASNVMERILVEEERYRSTREARRIAKGNRSSITSNNKHAKVTGMQGIWNFPSDAVQDDDNYFIGKNQCQLFSCLKLQDPSTREVKRFLESRTISYVQNLIATKMVCRMTRSFYLFFD
jgi:hypothetical protein